MKQQVISFLGNFLKDNPMWAKWLQVILVFMVIFSFAVDGVDVPKWVEVINNKMILAAEALGIILLQYPNEKPDYKD